MTTKQVLMSSGSEEFAKTQMCKKIAHLREMLLECLPYVQDCAVDPSYKERAKPEIKGLAKRIENEVRA